MAATIPPLGSLSASAQLSPDNLRFLLAYIQRESGIALTEEKLYLLQGRLTPLLPSENLRSLDDLCLRLRTAPPDALRRRVVEAMTTHETLFFRDPQMFDALRVHLFPELIRLRQATRTLRIWSAACSSGQEAYSLAMLLLELGLADWNIEIIATDISNQILDRAREARYYQIEMSRGLPSALLVKYFQRSGLDWQLKDHVRRLVRFSLFDLRQTMASLGNFDVVFCRNVLIYFDLETRKRILGGIRSQLCPGGYLVLGSSETTFSIDTIYQRKTLGAAIVYQSPAAGIPR